MNKVILDAGKGGGAGVVPRVPLNDLLSSRPAAPADAGRR